jgi:hypothetical protein
MSTDPKSPANDLEPEEINAPKAHNRGGKRVGAGRPKGPWAGKPWRDALIRAAKRRDPVSGYRMIELAAMRVVNTAVHGEDKPAMAAAAILGDRIDGKAHGNTGEGQARVSFVVHMPAQLAPEQWQRASGRLIEATPQEDVTRADRANPMQRLQRLGQEIERDVEAITREATTRPLDARPDPGATGDGDAPRYTLLDGDAQREGGSKGGSDDGEAR